MDTGCGSVSTTSTVAPGMSRAPSPNMSPLPEYVTITGDSVSVSVDIVTPLGASTASTCKTTVNYCTVHVVFSRVVHVYIIFMNGLISS